MLCGGSCEMPHFFKKSIFRNKNKAWKKTKTHVIVILFHNYLKNTRLLTKNNNFRLKNIFFEYTSPSLSIFFSFCP